MVLKKVEAPDEEKKQSPKRRMSKTKTMGEPISTNQFNEEESLKNSRSPSPVRWGKNKFERQKSNVKMSNIENLNKFVILQNIKRKYKESSVENNEESESFFIAADCEVLLPENSLSLNISPFPSKAAQQILHVPFQAII
jgi:hypothetical protein